MATDRQPAHEKAHSTSSSGIPVKPKPKRTKMTSDEQRRRFIEAAREAGASEDEAEFDRALGAIVKAKA